MPTCSAATCYAPVGHSRPRRRNLRHLRSQKTMTKRYQIIRQKMPSPTGTGFIEALRVAIVEFSCLGERRFDVSGYPHESVEDALSCDLQMLSDDYSRAQEKFDAELRAKGIASEREKAETAKADTEKGVGTAHPKNR